MNNKMNRKNVQELRLSDMLDSSRSQTSMVTVTRKPRLKTHKTPSVYDEFSERDKYKHLSVRKISNILRDQKEQKEDIKRLDRQNNGNPEGLSPLSPLSRHNTNKGNVVDDESDVQDIQEARVRQTDRVIYVEASDYPVAIILPPFFETYETLTIKRMSTSEQCVYIRAADGQSIEGSEIWSLEGDEMGAFILRWFEEKWYIMG